MNSRTNTSTSLASKLPAIPIWMIAAVLATLVGLIFWSVLNDGYANIWGLQIGHRPGKAEASPLIIDYGTELKASGVLSIKFHRKFSKPPTVLVSSFQKGATNGINNEPTVVDISETVFTVLSSSSASNYYISWVAFE